MVQHVAEKDGAVSSPRAGMDHDIARRVARRRLEPQPVFEREIVVDQLRLAGAHHRQYAVLKGAAMRRILAGLRNAPSQWLYSRRAMT